LPQLPRLVHQALSRPPAPDLSPLLAEIAAGQRRQNALLAVIATLLAGILAAPFFF
jgi:ubiquinone biosynthesis protein